MFARKHRTETYLEVESESRALRGKHARRAWRPVTPAAEERPLPAVNAVSQADLERKFNEFFRMGAVVAVGELFDEGLLGWPTCVAENVRGFLGSFGVNSVADVQALGVTGPYLEDFERVFAPEASVPPAA